MALFERHGEDVLEQLRGETPDPFAPIVIINPIAGFPKEFTSTTSGGKAITLATRERLQSFVMTDSDKKLDSAEMTFIDEEGAFADATQLIVGAVIDVSWGYKGKMSEPRRLIARRLKIGILQGRQYARRRRGFVVTIEGLAPTIVLNGKAPASNDIFEGKQLQTIVRTIGERMGFHESFRGDKWLNIHIHKEDNAYENSITRPRAMTNPQFLQMLAERHKLVFQVNKKGLFFGTPDLEAVPATVIDLNGDSLLGIELDGDLILGVPAGIKFVGYSPGDQKFIHFDKRESEKDKKKGGKGPAVGSLATTEEDAQPETSSTENETPLVEPVQSTLKGAGAVTLKTHSPGKRSIVNISNSVLEDYQHTTTTRLVGDIARGRKHRKKKAWKLTMQVVGNPKILAGTTILLQNFGTALLDGTWLVNEARHRIENAYITELTCGREAGKGKNAAGDIVFNDTNKSARTKADQEIDYSKSGVVEGKGAYRLKKQDPVSTKKAPKHESSSGTFKDVEHRARGR